jgi:ssDNA-binding Zn-finger/Zn-ribbon topoisomerase 1
MSWLLVLAVAVVLLAIAKRTAGAARQAPYEKAGALFTPAERSFLGVLDAAIGHHYHVFGKVRVADVLAVKKGLGQAAWRSAFNRISAKHFDFVLCSKDDLAVRCVIELNDQSHQQKQRQSRDQLLTEACQSAGLPLIFFAAQHAYSLAEVGARIDEVLAVPGGKTDAEPCVPSSAPAEAGPDAPLCPRCASPMVKRIAKGGENAGREFWGCPKFPACRGMVAF